MPCVDITISGETFTFMLNPSRYYSTVLNEVAQTVGTDPIAGTTTTINGLNVFSFFYRFPTLRLGGTAPLGSGYRIANSTMGLYSKHYNIQGILGARDMKDFAWDIDFSQQTVRIWKNIGEPSPAFKIQSLLIFDGGTQSIPCVSTNIANNFITAGFDFQAGEVLQMERVQLRELKDRGVVKPCGDDGEYNLSFDNNGIQLDISNDPTVSTLFSVRQGLDGYKFGGGYYPEIDMRYLFFQSRSGWPPYLFNSDIKIFEGYQSVIGAGFFQYLNRMIIDLQHNRLLMIPNEHRYDAFPEYWLRTGF